MTTDLQIPGAVNLTPFQALMIPVALVGAVFLSLGAQFQSRGVQRVEAKLGRQSKGLSVRHVLALLGSGWWVLGTLMLGLAVVLQLVSITYAPLIVVQPLGAVALVITTWFSSRSSGVPLGDRARRAVWTCIIGVAIFVGIAAFVGHESAIDRPQLVTVLVILAVVLAIVLTSFRFVAKHQNALYYIVGAGVLYGFVATLAKVVLNRFVNGTFDWLTVLAIVGVLVAAALGGYFVQNAYSSGSADLVIAGLTVIDPIIAVGIGVVVLGEADGAPWFAVLGFLVAAAIAITGVFLLAKHHPQGRS
ncbi:MULTISPECIES: multidrug DMT transporter permease [unclassified Curtobacterium]|uniref:multidrug DMT transporter permease n=1 Tax=unclassified Curtobacterium TaxID=257496 RepID=UPI0008246B83|nr:MULTISPECIES: multidrug DMT transporter permease [unclassified Curtobacterium]WIA98185.1 multidrug DMT transporter permease [Curtobacterium sp. MCBA15_004]WIB01439.1 multidrug DMT transporter permease [Curtobacterium sp. MCBA15_012]